MDSAPQRSNVGEMTMTSNYVVLGADPSDNAVVLIRLEGVPDDWELREGVPRARNFPPDAVYSMDPERKNNTILQDSLFNTGTLLNASESLKKFLATRKIPKVEY